MKESIPASCEPFKQWKQVPVHRVDAFAFLLMCAKIPTFYPELKPSPGEGSIRVDAHAPVRI